MSPIACSRFFRMQFNPYPFISLNCNFHSTDYVTYEFEEMPLVYFHGMIQNWTSSRCDCTIRENCFPMKIVLHEPEPFWPFRVPINEFTLAYTFPKGLDLRQQPVESNNFGLPAQNTVEMPSKRMLLIMQNRRDEESLKKPAITCHMQTIF